VAIAIGLFGIAASFSAQVLARRKEFGLLSHLGLARRQIVAVVAAEGAVWTGVGAVLGLVLGIAVSAGAREGGQPAELPLDDGPAAAVAAAWRASAPR
jgi:ABC-type antimicrobial peptide transport system permease subunit